MLNLYQMRRIRRLDRILYNLFKAFVFNALIISAILFSLKRPDFSREHLYATYLLLFVLIVLWRFFMLKIIVIYRKSGFNYSKVIIIGGGEVTKQLYSYFKNDNFLGVKLLAIFSDNKLKFDLDKKIFIGSIEDTKDFVVNNYIDEIFIQCH